MKGIEIKRYTVLSEGGREREAQREREGERERERRERESARIKISTKMPSTYMTEILH